MADAAPANEGSGAPAAGAQATPAAPAAQASAPVEKVSESSIRERSAKAREALLSPSPTVAAKPAEPPAADPVAKPATPAEPELELDTSTLKPPRPSSLQERLALKAQRQAAQQAAAQQSQSLESQMAELRSQLELTTGETARYKKALAEEDYDGALKILGVTDGVEGLTKRYLEKKGAIPKVDPKVAELEERVAAFEKAEREREETEARAREEAAATAEHQQLLTDIRAEAAASPYRQVKRLASVDGFDRLTANVLVQHPNLKMEQVWGIAVSSFEKLYKALHESGAFPDRGSVSRETTPALAGALQEVSPGRPGDEVEKPGPPVHLSQSSGSEVSAPKKSDPANFQQELRERAAAARARLLARAG